MDGTGRSAFTLTKRTCSYLPNWCHRSCFEFPACLLAFRAGDEAGTVVISDSAVDALFRPHLEVVSFEDAETQTPPVQNACLYTREHQSVLRVNILFFLQLNFSPFSWNLFAHVSAPPNWSPYPIMSKCDLCLVGD